MHSVSVFLLFWSSALWYKGLSDQKVSFSMTDIQFISTFGLSDHHFLGNVLFNYKKSSWSKKKNWLYPPILTEEFSSKYSVINLQLVLWRNMIFSCTRHVLFWTARTFGDIFLDVVNATRNFGRKFALCGEYSERKFVAIVHSSQKDLVGFVVCYWSM